MAKTRLGSLEERLLQVVASRLGPALDMVDVAAYREGLRVRGVLLELCVAKGPSPTEVRCALLNLIDQGLLAHGAVGCAQLLAPESEVQLTVRGLLAARKVDPSCGRPVAIVVLRMKSGRMAGVFNADFDTGSQDRDKELNKSGLSLAAFYVVAVKQPSKAQPLLLRDCRWWFARLACLGVSAKSGPGNRLLPSLESIGRALDRVASITSLCGTQGEDGRTTGWFLRAPFPEVRIVNASGRQFRDWTRMLHNLGLTLQGRPFLDRLNQEVEPLTDERLRGLESAES